VNLRAAVGGRQDQVAAVHRAASARGDLPGRPGRVCAHDRHPSGHDQEDAIVGPRGAPCQGGGKYRKPP